ncbi:MAG: hypothetical protein ACKPKO_58810, partial [Candidatus Fonsibacter sp.]
DLSGSDIMIWLAKVVDQIELKGKTDQMWAQEVNPTAIGTVSLIRYAPKSSDALSRLTKTSCPTINMQQLVSLER